MIRLHLRRHLSDAAGAVERAPVEVTLAVLVAASFSWAIETGIDEAFQTWWEVTTVALLVGSVAWMGTLLHGLGAWTVRRRQVVTVVAAVLAALYGALFLRLDLETHVGPPDTASWSPMRLPTCSPSVGPVHGILGHTALAVA